MTQNQGLSGFISILHSVNKQPLTMWEKKIRNGRIKRVRDEDLYSQALELLGAKPASTYISCPQDPKEILGITLPVLNMTVKNLNKVFAFDVQILDSKNVKRRFRASTFQSVAELKPFTCRLPLILEEGWNQITFPLQEFTSRCYGTNYVQTLRVQIHASCRIRRVYFSNRVYPENELPHEFKLNHLAIPKRVSQRFDAEASAKDNSRADEEPRKVASHNNNNNNNSKSTGNASNASNPNSNKNAKTVSSSHAKT